jgi:hypothetical protein
VTLARRLGSLLFVFWVAFLPTSYAQTTNGAVTGTVTDPSGSAVAGVQVQVKNQETAEQRTATTIENGTFIIPQLPPGRYDIVVEKQGFAKESRTNFTLLVNQNATLDFTLKVATISETVEATGAPPALNTTNATLGDVIEHQQIVDLPLNGRNFTQLTLLTPGSAPQESGQQSAFTVKLGAGAISPSVNGQRGQQNNFTMDGLLNNNIYTNTWAISPPIDALQEFNVQSHITDAQFFDLFRREYQHRKPVWHKPVSRPRMGIPPQRRAGRTQLFRSVQAPIPPKPIRRHVWRSRHKEQDLV